jgi:hypothetical protein
MTPILSQEGSTVSFVLSEVDPVLQGALRNMGYGEREDGFAKTYPAGTPGLEATFETFARHAEEMILQAARLRPVPWEKALLAFLDLVADRDIRWWLRGSAALAVRGLEVAPGDIDLTVAGEDVHALDDLMRAHLVEPLVPVEGWVCEWWSRAFLHARIEWMGGVLASADEPEPSDFGPVAEREAETVHWRGHALRVPPLSLQLAVTRRRGLVARATLIEEALAARGYTISGCLVNQITRAEREGTNTDSDKNGTNP